MPEYIIRNARAEVRIRFEEACDICQVFQPFARTPLRILERPHFSLQHVLDRRH
jgi:hypothetical protein